MSVHEFRRTDTAAMKLRVEQEVARMLKHLDPTSPRKGTDDTPSRVARMYVDELCSGYRESAADVLRTFDSEGYDGMVVLRDVPFVSLCEHHLVPFVGYAHIGYFPDQKVVGLSKIARVVSVYARRLQIQERLTRQITQCLEEHLSARGVIAVLEAEHMCMTIRGVQAPGTKTITSSVCGMFEENKDDCKTEFLRLIGK